MEIINKTDYETRKLRSLICAVYRRLEKIEGPLRHWPYLKIEIRYGNMRGRGSNGKARIDGPYMWLWLPRKGECDVLWLAHVIEHELQHNYGYRHPSMAKVRSKNWKHIGPQFAWAVDLVGNYLYTKAPKRKAKPDLQTERYKKLCEREKKWISKLKRAQNALAKIKQSKRYYEKALAAKKTNANTEPNP